MDYTVTSELPDEVLVTGAVQVAHFIDSDGRSGYAVTTRGENTSVVYLGLLRRAEHEILKWDNEDD